MSSYRFVGERGTPERVLKKAADPLEKAQALKEDCKNNNWKSLKEKYKSKAKKNGGEARAAKVNFQRTLMRVRIAYLSVFLAIALAFRFA